eukprot:s1934_g7.t1
MKTIVTSRHALGLKTRIYTTKVKDSAGNAPVENSIQRIRQLACTLVEDVCERTGLVFPCEHALWSWAGRHAAWCLNRFQVCKSLTSYEVTHGKRYSGKTACFAEPVYAYCKGRGKADAKWRVGLMLGKTEAQDAWIIGDGVDVMLSRSIRRVDRPWHSFWAYYSGLQTHSYVYQTNFGGRIVPTKRKIVPQKQEGKLLPKMSEVERRFADEEARAVLAYARSRQGRLESQREVQEALEALPEDLPPGVAVQVEEPPLPPGPLHGEEGQAGSFSMSSQPANAELLAQPSSPRKSSMKHSEAELGEHGEEESSMKRTRHEENVMRRVAMIERRLVEVQIGDEQFYQLDNVIDQDFVNAYEAEEIEPNEKISIDVNKLEKLWCDDSLTRTPQDPDPEVDKLADAIELQQLQDMGVIEVLSDADSELASLTTRMVYDWRIKEWKNPVSGETKRRWMRRARLVAREYATHRRDDVHSPASGGQALRLLPAVYLMLLGAEGIPREQLQIGSLDVKDAFLQAHQEEAVQIYTKNGKFKVLKNLPGQRLAAKAWYEYLATFLKKKGVEFSTENPCLGRRGDRLFLLLHVDDKMFCGFEDEVQKLITELKTEFVISHKVAQFPGDEFEFLRRTYKVTEDGLDIMPGRYAETMVKGLEEKYGKVKQQNTPCGDEAQEIANPMLLPADEAALFRSLVGSGIYLSQERIELGYVIKQLASGMSSPTYGHLQVMRRLIGYLKNSMGNYNHLAMPSYGKGIHHHYDSKWILESFIDSDWSGMFQEKLLWVQDQTSSKTLEVKQISTSLNIGDIGAKPLGRLRLQALMFWCNLYNKDGNPIGEEEAMKVKENGVNKAKIMRVAKLLQTMVIFGGLEQACGELVPFRMDMETITPVEEKIWFSFGTLYILSFFAVLVGFFMVYKAYMKLHREVRNLRVELQIYQGQMDQRVSRIDNESSMQHLHEFMKAEDLEWPYHDYSASHDRAQLTALQWIHGFSRRQARAIREGNERLATWCNSQIGLHRSTPLLLAARQGRGEVVELLLRKSGARGEVYEYGPGSSPLCFAAHLGLVEVVTVLLMSGMSVESKDKLGFRALHWAADGGHLAVVEKLISAGAEIDAVTDDISGQTPLHMAFRFVKVVEVLLKSGASVEAKDKRGRTPLMYAVNYHPLEDTVKTVELLLKTGASVEAKDEDGNTALHLVIMWNRKDRRLATVVKKLYYGLPYHGSNSHVMHDKNNIGKTPWDLAENGEHNRAEVMKLLGLA